MRPSINVLLPVIAGLLVSDAATAGSLRAAPPGQLVKAPDRVSGMELVTLDRGLAPALLAVAPETQVVIEDWPVAPGARRAVVVARHEVYASDAKIVVIDHRGEVEVPRSRLAFFWGSVDGEGASRVLIVVDPRTLSFAGFTDSIHGRAEIHPPPEYDRRRHAVAPPDSLRQPGAAAPPFRCGSSAKAFAPSASRGTAGARKGPREARIISGLHTAVVAVDTDNALLNVNFMDDTTSATDYLAQLFAGLNVFYERDLLVRLLQGYTVLRVSTALDPYLQGGSGNASFAQIIEVSDYWNTKYASVKRALVMMLSSNYQGSLHGGIAWIGGLCDNRWGVSFNQVSKAGPRPTFADWLLVGHEIGHNFGASHTHCTDTSLGTPGIQPIDFCDSAECGASWSPPAAPSCPAPSTINPVNGPSVTDVRGTLMSYCHVLAGCRSTTVFHPQSAEVVFPVIDVSLNQCVFPVLGNAGPSVTAITPPSGSPAGGTSVTITGTNFRAPAAVAFADLRESQAALSVSVVSPTTITATTPAHTSGIKDVVVSNPDLQTGALRGSFRYEGPTITQISPNRGATSGGTPVTIAGTGFVAPASVTLGGLAATSVEVVDATTLTALTPAQGAGQVEVVVTMPGPVVANLVRGYLYVVPPPPSRFYTLTPCRLIDTRGFPGHTGGPALLPSARRNFLTTGITCGVPLAAKALSVNVTVTGATAPGFVSLFPGDGSAPPTSNINFGVGQTRANNAVAPISTDGTGVLAVLNGAAGTVHLILDVNGYFE